MLSFKLKKIFGLSKVSENNSGIIIYVVLWVVVILTSLAVSLGRSTQMGLSLTKHNIGKVRSENLVWGGLSYSVDLIKSSEKEKTSYDTFLYCGISPDLKKTPQELFEKHTLQDGYFSISYLDEDGQRIYGLQDQERLININTFGLDQQDVFIQLIMLLGYDEKLAQTIAASVIDWRDADSGVSGDSLGAEDDYYMQTKTPYHCKNSPFDAKEELLLVKGITPEIFDKIKNFVTVFPKEGVFQINFNTASRTVLRSITRLAAGAATNTQIYDADSLVDKIINYRQGPDRKVATADDAEVDFLKMNLNEKEHVIALVINQLQTARSSYLKADIRGTDELYGVSTQIQAVIDRDSLKIVSWVHK